MTANWEKKGTNDGVLTFDIPTEKIEEGLKAAYNKVKNSINIPGFRKGKVPRQIFIKTYGEESLYEDALNHVLPELYEIAIQETGIDPVAQPKIDVKSMEKGQAWVIEAEVTVKPEVRLGEYKNLTVTKQEREVTDADVEAELLKKQESFAELVIKEEAAASGDTVVIDFEGFKAGEPFEGGKAENHSLELGSGAFIPGFEDQLVGVKTGDELDVTVTFPENYQAEDLAGQEAVFKVKVHEVKTKELPALDDDLAMDIDEEVENLAQLKEKIKVQLTEQKETAAKEAIEEEAIAKAVENAEIIELPEVMVHDEVHRGMHEFLSNMERQGISKEMYFQLTGTTEADLHAKYEVDAEMKVKTSLVIEAIVEAENYTVTTEDIQAEIEDLAGQYGMKADDIRAALTDEMLSHDIKMKKAVAVITDTATEA